ncbi:hypothetical protein GGR51DRAFT_520283 [Nemania sp. FL0031]|nr:hypothetical protein GGR51DRAFT_520283 [Nemania sp. FL0031]
MMLDIVAESQVNGPVGGIDTTKLLGVVREVYTRENSVAVEMFKHTVGIAIHSALPRLESAKLIDLINEIPAVGGDIRAFSLSRHQLCGGYPDYCIQCGTPCIEDLGFLAMVLPTGGPIYFCHHCRPDRLNNEGRW